MARILSTTRAMVPASTKAETVVKYMLSVARTTTSSSTTCAASVATEANSASPGAISGLASPAALMETNATIIPSMGERPTARKATAPSGIRTTYAESERNFPSTPPRATPRTTVRGDRPESMRRASASKSPDRSATATPSITISTVPSGPKVTKDSWAPLIKSRTASAERALRTPTGSPERGVLDLQADCVQGEADHRDGPAQDPEQPERMRQCVPRALDPVEEPEAATPLVGLTAGTSRVRNVRSAHSDLHGMRNEGTARLPIRADVLGTGAGGRARTVHGCRRDSLGASWVALHSRSRAGPRHPPAEQLTR